MQCGTLIFQFTLQNFTLESISWALGKFGAPWFRGSLPLRGLFRRGTAPSSAYLKAASGYFTGELFRGSVVLWWPPAVAELLGRFPPCAFDAGHWETDGHRILLKQAIMFPVCLVNILGRPGDSQTTIYGGGHLSGPGRLGRFGQDFRRWRTPENRQEWIGIACCQVGPEHSAEEGGRGCRGVMDKLLKEKKPTADLDAVLKELGLESEASRFKSLQAFKHRM